MSVILTAQQFSKSFGTRSLFSGIGISLHERERLALIGPNGSGKSTLLRILAGLETADEGKLTIRKGVRVAYVAQKDTFPEGSTVRSAVVDSLWKDPSTRPPSIHDEHEAELAAEMALDRAGFEDLDQPTAGLSGGQRKRLAIARELAREPDALLLDEPTNHLDLEGIEWLEGVLKQGDFASIIITHDREFLETVATRIAELSRQYPDGLFAIPGQYSEFLRRKQEFLDGQSQQERSLANQVREDLRWLGRGAKARRTKSKSRIGASHERIEELAALRGRNAAVKAAGIDWEATGRMTQKLVVARAITKQLGGRALFTDLDLVLSPGSCVGLLGPNGSGKSTLIRVLTGQLEPDPPTPGAVKAAAEAVGVPPGTPPPGTIRRADKLRTVVFTQHRTDIDPTDTLSDALSPGSDAVIYRGRTLHVNTWARKFLFTAEQLRQPVRSLSGGELARIHIARLMLEPADVLVLDEPTNDLDLASLEVLEESIEEFPGAVILVTHDRAMIARLSTQIVALDGRGAARHFADYDQWEASHRESLKAERASSATATPPPPPPTPRPEKKLTYNEQRELAGMEKSIHQAETKVRDLEQQMADANAAADHRRLDACCRDLSAAQATVTRLYERWAELEARQA